MSIHIGPGQCICVPEPLLSRLTLRTDSATAPSVPELMISDVPEKVVGGRRANDDSTVWDTRTVCSQEKGSRPRLPVGRTLYPQCSWVSDLAGSLSLRARTQRWFTFCPNAASIIFGKVEPHVGLSAAITLRRTRHMLMSLHSSMFKRMIMPVPVSTPCRAYLLNTSQG